MTELGTTAAWFLDQARTLDQLRDALVVLDDENRIRYLNPAAYRLYEIGRNEPVSGSRLGEFFRLEWKNERELAEYARCLQNAGFWRGENIHVTHTGRRFWGESVVSSIRNAEGHALGLIAIVRNVSARKEAEAALEESRERMRLTNEAAGVGTWSFQPDTDTAAGDATTRAHWGFSPNEPITYEKIVSRIYPEDRPLVQASIEALRAGEAWQTIDIRTVLRDGAMRYLRSTGRRITDKTGRLRIIGTSLDITRQKETEQALRHYADGLSFLSDTALEMMRPLNLAGLYALLATRLYAVADGAIVIVNEYDPRNETTILREVRGTDEERATAQRLFGRDPVGITLAFREETRARMLWGELALVEGGVCDLAFYELSPTLCKALERELNIGDIYAMACCVGHDFLGTVAILTHGHGYPRNKHLIESTVSQAGLALQRRRAEDVLRNERNFYETILNTQGAVVAIIESGCVIGRLNRAYYDISGNAPGSMNGRYFWEIMADTDVHAVKLHLSRLVRGKTPGEYESRIAVKGGGVRTIRWRDTVLWGQDGTLQNVIATGIDISDRIEAERNIRQLNESLKREARELEYANRRLDQLSMEDPLTGIANRRLLTQIIEREWPRAQRYAHAVSLLMVDIDYFKDYNDLYGHPHGDECLRRVARCLADHARRPVDIVARVGGEEFAVLLLETDQTGAVKLAEEMREAVAALRIPHARSTVAPVITVSIGVGSLNARAAEFSGLMELADEALYRAKSAGRNRVAVLSR